MNLPKALFIYKLAINDKSISLIRRLLVENRALGHGVEAGQFILCEMFFFCSCVCVFVNTLLGTNVYNPCYLLTAV